MILRTIPTPSSHVVPVQLGLTSRLLSRQRQPGPAEREQSHSGDSVRTLGTSWDPSPQGRGAALITAVGT